MLLFVQEQVEFFYSRREKKTNKNEFVLFFFHAEFSNFLITIGKKNDISINKKSAKTIYSLCER